MHVFVDGLKKMQINRKQSQDNHLLGLNRTERSTHTFNNIIKYNVEYDKVTSENSYRVFLFLKVQLNPLNRDRPVVAGGDKTWAGSCVLEPRAALCLFIPKNEHIMIQTAVPVEVQG